MPPALDLLLQAARSDLDELSAEMAAGRLTPDELQQDTARVLLEFHTSAYFAASGERTLSPDAKEMLSEIIGEQLDYLNGFVDTIDAEGWQPAYAARLRMYAGSIKQSYGVGLGTWEEGLIVLPGMPADGQTPCLVACRCSWERMIVDAGRGHFDYFWRIDSDAENCTGCQERAARWNPLRVRFGEVVA